MNDLKNDLKKNIIEVLNLQGVDPDQLDDTKPLLDSDWGLDSIDLLEIVVMLKKKYNVNIRNLQDAKNNLKTIADIERHINDSNEITRENQSFPLR